MRMYMFMQKHTHTHCCGVYSIACRPALMELVVRINTCQVGALVQYRRGQTVTESGEKIIILIMMPWRLTFIYQSTSPPPPVTLSPDPPCSLHLDSNLIDFLHKYLIFLLCSSTMLLFIPLLYPSLCYPRWQNFTSCSTYSLCLSVNSLTGMSFLAL